MRREHLLKINEKVEIPKKIVYFDTESRTKTKIDEEDIERLIQNNREDIRYEHKHYLTAACFVNRKGKEKEEWKFYYDDTLNCFWYDVDKFVHRGERVYVFAHNLKYDILVSGGIEILISLGYELEKFSESNPCFFTFRKREGEKCKTIQCVSTTNYFATSIEKLGKTFGLEKLSIDYENEKIENVLVYAKRDVEIMKTAMEKFIEMIVEENLGNFSLTVAGQSLNAFRHRFMKSEIYIHCNENALRLERQAYAGGRNEAWRIGKIDEKVYYVDVNSMYPFVMKNNRYPVKLLTYVKSINVKELKQLIEEGFLVIAKVKVKTDLPVFFKKCQKLIFPVGEFYTTLSTPELKYGIENNLLVEVKEAAIYEGEIIFDEYVEYFYSKRMEAKKRGDEVLTFFYKIFLNSLYGKFGQKRPNYELVGEIDEFKFGEEFVVDDKGRRAKIKYIGNKVFMSVHGDEGIEEESENSFPAIAAHVTAYGRMLLWYYIMTAGIDNVYYMDTDSLFVNEQGYKNLLKAGCLDDYELGKMKLEECSNYVEIRGCKDYKFGEKEKIKGVAKNSIKVDDNNYICVQWLGVSNFLKSGKLHGYETKLIWKTLKRQYEKGIIENGFVKPILIKE